MKLKNILRLSFLAVTLIPITIVLMLFYKSGYDLSKQSYINNLVESINVQSDYISQTLENDMIFTNRFAQKNIRKGIEKDDIYDSMQVYLENAEDTFIACLILNELDEPIYSIGEKKVNDEILRQLPNMQDNNRQTIQEFLLSQNNHTLGIQTPVFDNHGEYQGGMISVYDVSYIFKIISSYYTVADTGTYIIDNNENVLNLQGSSEDAQEQDVLHALADIELTKEGYIENSAVHGYYNNINNSPWHLAGFLNEHIIMDFTNQFVWAYFGIIIIVLLLDVVFAFYFSNKVVHPINALISIMDAYQNNLNFDEQKQIQSKDFYETKYLRQKFFDLMRTVLYTQHNFEGIYQLYQSADMGDINIDINVIEQSISCNKIVFKELINEVDVGSEACIVENFSECFIPSDQEKLQTIFESMRDNHLSVPCEAEIHTMHLNEKWFHCVVVPLYDNERLSRLFIQLRDISNFKRQEIASSEQVRRDALTKLYNRSGCIEMIKQSLETCDSETTHAVIFIDIDYFKLVNDNFGHQAGDELLIKIANTLTDIAKNLGVVARYGGDEFVLFFHDTTSVMLAQLEVSIHEQILYPYQNGDISFKVSASIGISTWTGNDHYQVEEIIKQADAKMYQAKRHLKQNDTM